jgi:hypothetical protein
LLVFCCLWCVQGRRIFGSTFPPTSDGPPVARLAQLSGNLQQQQEMPTRHHWGHHPSLLLQQQQQQQALRALDCQTPTWCHWAFDRFVVVAASSAIMKRFRVQQARRPAVADGCVLLLSLVIVKYGEGFLEWGCQPDSQAHPLPPPPIPPSLPLAH